MGLNVLCPFSELNEMFDDCQFVPSKHRVFLNLITSFYRGKFKKKKNYSVTDVQCV